MSQARRRSRNGTDLVRAVATLTIAAVALACTGDDASPTSTSSSGPPPVTVERAAADTASPATAIGTSTTSSTSTSVMATTTTLPELQLVLEPVATLTGRNLTPVATDGAGFVALSDTDGGGTGAPPSVVRIDAAGSIVQETPAPDAGALFGAALGADHWYVYAFAPTGCSIRALDGTTLALGPPLALPVTTACGGSIAADAVDPAVMLVTVPAEPLVLRADTRTGLVERVSVESVSPGGSAFDVLSLPEATYVVLSAADSSGFELARVDRVTGAATVAEIDSFVEEAGGRLLMHLPDRSRILDPVTLTASDAAPADLPTWLVREASTSVTVEHREPTSPNTVRAASIDPATVSARPLWWSGVATPAGYLLIGVEVADSTGADPVTHIYRAAIRPVG